MKPLFLSVVLVLMASGGLYAYQSTCPGQGHYQDVLSDLNPEQQAAVKTLTDTHHTRLFALQKEIRTSHAAMEALFATTPVDKTAVDKAVAKLSELQAQKAQLNADYRIALTQITGKPLPLNAECTTGRPCGARTAPPCGAAQQVPCNAPGCPAAEQQ